MEKQPLTEKQKKGILLYKSGIELYNHGKKEDTVKGERYYIDAAEDDFNSAITLGNTNAMIKMGDILLYGSYGYSFTDKDAAIELYKKAADLNNSQALIKLGDLYLNGYKSLVEKDYNVAIKYYELADLLNNSKASYSLGLIYSDGKGVTQDNCRALKYFEKAGSLGNDEASYILGEKYRNGFDVEQDYNRAFKYYEKASLLSNGQALNRLGWLYNRGLGVKQDYVKAMECFTKATRTKNNKDALNSIGCLDYRRNDLVSARNYFERVGSWDGKNNLIVLNYKENYHIPIGLRPKGMNGYSWNDWDHQENQTKQKEELLQEYKNAKEYFYNAAYKGNSDAIADNDVLLYVIERVKSDYSRDGLKSQAQLLANLQAQPEQLLQEELLEQLQGQHGGYKQKYLKYKKKYIHLKN